MKCVILAAGEGKRMHPLTFTRPKVMLPIANKPILEWNLLNAIDAGLTEFVFVVGYKSEMVRSYFGDGKKWDVSIEYVNQGTALGTAHAIGMVEKFVDNFIVLCGDTIFGTQDIRQVIEREISMGLVQVESPEEYGIVEMDGEKVVKIYEKMKDPFSNVINAGIYHFNQSIFDIIKETERSPRGEYEITSSINMLVKDVELSGIMLKEWRDVAYPWHLLDANEEMLKGIQGNIEGTVEENVILKGPVFIGKGTKVMSGSYIEGPVVIGDDCKIGPNCYIRPCTSIGDECHVGAACEIKNSIIMNRSNVPHQNYVGDSVIGADCNLGSGTKIANLKLDKKSIIAVVNGKRLNTKRRKLGVVMGDHVQTGINAMFNVGSMVGNNVFVGPGAAVTGEVKPYAKLW
ncbi:MAG: bifunctional sugar-1-phosphate nucleotidylyltransferase/acetyltransferase [Candidatus Thermoplasmatota archaeon]|nr:bifunctional sugar-1-phosphate nucleotidylyltransferase/acetyltransferase [Candidatus Thermoplasmatota archaeon]